MPRWQERWTGIPACSPRDHRSLSFPTCKRGQWYSRGRAHAIAHALPGVRKCWLSTCGSCTQCGDSGVCLPSCHLGSTPPVPCPREPGAQGKPDSEHTEWQQAQGPGQGWSLASQPGQAGCGRLRVRARARAHLWVTATRRCPQAQQPPAQGPGGPGPGLSRSAPSSVRPRPGQACDGGAPFQASLFQESPRNQNFLSHRLRGCGWRREGRAGRGGGGGSLAPSVGPAVGTAPSLPGELGLCRSGPVPNRPEGLAASLVLTLPLATSLGQVVAPQQCPGRSRELRGLGVALQAQPCLLLVCLNPTHLDQPQVS